MCGGCVKTEYPSRGNICLENGSYLLNYLACIECKKRDFVMITNRASEEEDGEEIITYDHVCKNCHHVIARHEYSFSVVDDYQIRRRARPDVCKDLAGAYGGSRSLRNIPCCVCSVAKQKILSASCLMILI